MSWRRWTIGFVSAVILSGCGRVLYEVSTAAADLGSCLATGSRRSDGSYHCSVETERPGYVAPEGASLTNRPRVASPRGLSDYLSIGHAALASSDYDAAVVAFDSASAIAVSTLASEPEIESRTYAAIAAGKAGRSKEARARMDTATMRFATAALDTRANVEALRAAVYRDNGWPRNALKQFATARTWFHELRDYTSEAAVLDEMAAISAKLRDDRSAARFRSEAKRLRNSR